jgi:hypothetical protein
MLWVWYSLSAVEYRNDKSTKLTVAAVSLPTKSPSTVIGLFPDVCPIRGTLSPDVLIGVSMKELTRSSLIQHLETCFPLQNWHSANFTCDFWWWQCCSGANH